MTHRSHEIRRLLWDAERLAKSRPRIRLMVSRGSRWIGGCGPWDDITRDYIPTSWTPFMCSKGLHVKHLFARNYHIWLASTSLHAIGECCELAYAASALLLSSQTLAPLDKFGDHFQRFQDGQPAASEVSVFTALAETAADGVELTRQRERICRNLQYATFGFGIKVSEVNGSFDAVKSVPNYERYFSGWDAPDAGYFIEALRDATGAMAKILHQAAQATSSVPPPNTLGPDTSLVERGWSIEKIDHADRLSKLPAHVLASVLVAADKSPAEVRKLVARHALEASHGNLKAALRQMKEDGYEISQSTMYNYRKELLAAGVDLPSQRRVSKTDGIPDGLKIVRSRRKSEDHKG